MEAGRGDSARDVQTKKIAGVRETGRQVTRGYRKDAGYQEGFELDELLCK